MLLTPIAAAALALQLQPATSPDEVAQGAWAQCLLGEVDRRTTMGTAAGVTVDSAMAACLAEEQTALSMFGSSGPQIPPGEMDQAKASLRTYFRNAASRRAVQNLLQLARSRSGR